MHLGACRGYYLHVGPVMAVHAHQRERVLHARAPPVSPAGFQQLSTTFDTF